MSIDGTAEIFDIKSFFKKYAILFALIVVMSLLNMDSTAFLYMGIVSIFYIYYFFTATGINIKFDNFVLAKRQLMTSIFVITAFAAMILFLASGVLDKSYHRHNLVYYGIGFTLLFISLILLYFARKDQVRKKAEDFDGLLVQEKMYDEIKIDLKDAFAYRIKQIIKPPTFKKNRFLPKKFHKQLSEKKVSKEIFAPDIDSDVVDIFQVILPERLKEIRDILLLNEKARPFREYWLTVLDVDNKEEVSAYISSLEKPILSTKEKNLFYRFFYQLIVKKIKGVQKNYDFEVALKRFNGVVEYAILDMFLYAREFLNIPMGNMLAYAAESKQSRHFYGAANSITIESVGRYGIGIYAGFYLAKAQLERNEV